MKSQDLNKLTIPLLREIAEKKKVKFTTKTTKSDLIVGIEEAKAKRASKVKIGPSIAGEY